MTKSPKPDPGERASLHGPTPEEALRALLAVDPDDPPADETETDEPPSI